ncbi:hypothetical protein M8818_001273 [Zalaria obscura]|uniref:Uncharacterized protein n=1 Tax=Zalaria obscura TaxID=2024903 RepID=A0ACC3SMQ4_9PEZI
MPRRRNLLIRHHPLIQDLTPIGSFEFPQRPSNVAGFYCAKVKAGNASFGTACAAEGLPVPCQAGQLVLVHLQASPASHNTTHPKVRCGTRPHNSAQPGQQPMRARSFVLGLDRCAWRSKTECGRLGTLRAF